MNQTNCPYCKKPLTKTKPDLFEACPGCGYRSARVDTGSGEYIIIDSTLPDLMTNYARLQKDNDEPVIVIDRRISHNPVAGIERRRG